MWFYIKNNINKILAIILLLVFISLQISNANNEKGFKSLPYPPRDNSFFDFNFAEPRLVARAAMLWLQTFDMQSGKLIQFQDIDYNALIAWLSLIDKLDGDSQYGLLSAAHIFIETKDQKQVRLILNYIEESFTRSPEQFWRWQAYAVILAKHRLKDIDYALKLAQNLNKLTKIRQVDHWARDLEFLILEDIGEFEASVLMIKSLLDSGEINDARELDFLNNKLKEIKKRK